MAVNIHPTAIVASGAILGEGVSVGAYSVIDDNVIIGDNTVINPFVRICNYTRIGSNCRVFENAVLGQEPQDLGYKGEQTWVHVGDRVTIRESVTINRASKEGVTSVGDDCLIMEGVHIAHNVVLGKKVVVSSKCGFAGYVTVGDYSVIGGLAGFHQFVRVGRFCMVGGLSRNVQDIPPFTIVSGSPSRIYGLNVVGLRRNGFSSSERTFLRRIYKELYFSGLPLREALGKVEAESGKDSYVAEIIDFYKTGKRGFCSWSFRQEKGIKDDREVE